MATTLKKILFKLEQNEENSDESFHDDFKHVVLEKKFSIDESLVLDHTPPSKKPLKRTRSAATLTSYGTNVENLVFEKKLFFDENLVLDHTPSSKKTLKRTRSAAALTVYGTGLQIEPNKILEPELLDKLEKLEQLSGSTHLTWSEDIPLSVGKERSDLEQSSAYLQQQCGLCMDTFPINKIVCMLKCTHQCCYECAKSSFTIQILEHSINDCNCPFCKLPELNDDNANKDEIFEYFSLLDILLKGIVDADVHEIFQRKLRDRALMQDPNFIWCSQCSSGCIAEATHTRLTCPECGSDTCAMCRKPWEEQHEGLNCEKFQEWKEANDPDKQAAGLAHHLDQYGVVCPKCKFKYSLARGGCIHLTCIKCGLEFCYGCGKPFLRGRKCTFSRDCANLGLHSHHPRNCLFYLRDKEPHELQKLLTMNNISFDTKKRDNYEKENANNFSQCPIQQQVETLTGFVDTICKGDVPQNHAGLCRQHYVEYLASVVSKANIDPLPILDLTDCVQELGRRGISLPERGPWDTDKIYREKCSKIIKSKAPLN